MKSIRVFGTLLLLCMSGLVGEATTALMLSNQALTDGADVILTGRCVALQPTWEGRTLVTVATVEVSDALKGEPGTTLNVALPGGIDSNRRFPIAMTYAGAPQMKVGEDVFLFLARDARIASGLTVMGFSQGKFSIVADPGGTPFVSRDLTQVTLASPAGTRRGTATRVSLEAFKREIQNYLSRR